MNIFLFFFLSVVVISAAPHLAPASNKQQQKSEKLVDSSNQSCQKQYIEGRALLQNIIYHAKYLTANLTKQMLQNKVQNVFMDKECCCMKICQAGKVLSVYQASGLGLNSKRDWRLPRMLYSFSKLRNCTISEKMENSTLHQLLDQIVSCAKKVYMKY